jgi:hypothetical protein
MTNQGFAVVMVPQELHKGSAPLFSPDKAQRNPGLIPRSGIRISLPSSGLRFYSAGLVEPLEGFGPVMVAAWAFFSTRRTA